MKLHTALALAALLAASGAAQAKGFKARSGGSHSSSGHSSSGGHAESSGGGVHLPTVRARGNSNDSNNANGAPAAGEQAARPTGNAADDRIAAELAKRRAADGANAPQPEMVPVSVAAPVTSAPKAIVRTPVQAAPMAAPKPYDLAHLVPRDAAVKREVDISKASEGYSISSQGVNCTLFPNRCR